MNEADKPARHTAEDRNARRARACLWVLLLISSSCLLVTGARLFMQAFGFLLASWQMLAARQVIALMFIQCVIYLLLLRAGSRGGLRSDRAPKIILASLPVILWINTDRMITVDLRARTQANDNLLQTHPTRLWTSKRNAESSRFDLIYRTNSLGHRGPELISHPPNNHKRVVVLGDSVAFGLFLAQDDTLTARLGELSGARCPDASIEWVNLSVRGYSPFQQLDLLREQFDILQPDMVIQTICLNDINAKFTLVTYGGLISYVAARHDPSPLEFFGTYRVLKRIADRFIAPSDRALEEQEARFGLDRLLDDPDSQDMQRAWAVTRENLLKTVDFLDKRDVPTALVVFPIARQIGSSDEKDRTPQKLFRSFADETGVPMLDLLPGYEELARRNSVNGYHLLPDEIHPTAAAMKESAILTFNFLVKTWPGVLCGKLDGGDGSPPETDEW